MHICNSSQINRKISVLKAGMLWLRHVYLLDYLLFLGILEGADLDTLSSKKVRQQLEEKLKFDLSDRLECLLLLYMS